MPDPLSNVQSDYRCDLQPAVSASLLSDQKEFALLVGRDRFHQAVATFNLPAITEGCRDAPFWLGEQHH